MFCNHLQILLKRIILKGQCHEIFNPFSFLYIKNSPRINVSLVNRLKQFRKLRMNALSLTREFRTLRTRRETVSVRSYGSQVESFEHKNWIKNLVTL